MSDPRVAPSAARFGAVAAGYERARPSYPAAVLDELAARSGLGPGTVVLDLAAGTGKLTRQLVPFGAQVVAVEPSAGMRAQFEHAVPGVPVLDGTAEAIPLGDAAVDVATVAQAFHWFDVPRALGELARVIRPHGWLALLWHEPPRVGWAAALWEHRQRVSGFTPTVYPGQGWQAVLDADARFGARTTTTVVTTVATTVAAEVDESASRTAVHVLDGERRRRVLDDMAAFLASHPETAGRDHLTYERPCSLHLCQRLA